MTLVFTRRSLRLITTTIIMVHHHCTALMIFHHAGSPAADKELKKIKIVVTKKGLRIATVPLSAHWSIFVVAFRAVRKKSISIWCPEQTTTTKTTTHNVLLYNYVHQIGKYPSRSSMLINMMACHQLLVKVMLINTRLDFFYCEMMMKCFFVQIIKRSYKLFYRSRQNDF